MSSWSDLPSREQETHGTSFSVRQFKQKDPFDTQLASDPIIRASIRFVVDVRRGANFVKVLAIAGIHDGPLHQHANLMEVLPVWNLLSLVAPRVEDLLTITVQGQIHLKQRMVDMTQH